MKLPFAVLSSGLSYTFFSCGICPPVKHTADGCE